jgi:hypothetical protein
MVEQTNAKVIKEYFGKLPGQTLQDFLGEFKQLSDADKQQLGDGIRNGSLTY